VIRRLHAWGRSARITIAHHDVAGDRCAAGFRSGRGPERV